jgi:hypothetical protein
MKRKVLFLLAAFSLFNYSKTLAQGGTCGTALPVTPGTFTASALTGVPSQLDATAAGWYSFTPSNSGIMNINSCSGGADTRLWIWSGNCAALTPVANNDDFAGCISTGTDAYASRIDNVILLAGNTYYFEWDDVWDANGFTWNFTFSPLPSNNDSEINYLTNRYTRIPISQAPNGITLGGTIKNLSANSLTNVVLTAEIYELPNTTTPITTFSSTPINLGIGGQQVVVSGVWAPSLTASKSYQIKYIKTQNEIDQVVTNNLAQQDLILDYNYMARDNNVYTTAFNWSTTSGYSQGVQYSVLGADQMTGAQFYIASTSTTQAYTVQVFSVTNGVVGATPLYTSASITNNGAGWKNHVFPAPIAVTAGEYLVAITKTGTTSFPLGCDASLFTNGRNLVRVGTGAWNPMELYGVSYAFMIRPKFGSDPVNDIVYVSNLNPGGEYTRIHSRQSLNGNDLQFSANGKNIGTSTIQGVVMTATLIDGQGTVVYTATSAAQDLTAGQTGTFTIPNYLVTSYDNYTINYVFAAATDQIPQNNSATTGFSRTKQSMSRTYGITGSLGIGNNATTGVYDNGILGQTYTLPANDYLDSVQFVLNAGTPSGQPVRVDIYATSNGVPTGTPIASTTTYTTTVADNTSGVVLKLPIQGGTLSLTAGTYFFGVIENAGNIRLATSSSYHTPNRAFLKWDQSPAGAATWATVEQFNFLISYVINPIFQTCVPMQIVETVTAASCGSSDGAIDNTLSGGTGTLSILWTNGQSTEDLTGLSSGAYSISLTDINACSVTENIIVPSLSNLSVSSSSNDVNCANTSSGQIILTAANGVEPYTYLWSNNVAAADTATNLSAGTYSCTVTDATGCVVVVFDTLTELSQIQAITTADVVVCSPTATTDIVANAQNGVGPYTFDWLNSSVTEPTFQSATIGNYVCIITDSLGCSDTLSTNVLLTNFSANVSSNNLLCNGTNAGSVTISATGGSTPYVYDWTNSTSSSATLAGLSGGTYECIVTDAFGCIDSVSTVVNEPSAFSVSVLVTDELIGNDGSVDLSVSGATAPYSFSWGNGATTEDIAGLDSGDYVFIISDANGCTYSDTVTVLSSTVGINNQIGEINWTIYPNPGVDFLTITGMINGQADVMDINGKVIVSAIISENERSLNLSSLERGTYLIKFNESIKCWVKH